MHAAVLTDFFSTDRGRKACTGRTQESNQGSQIVLPEGDRAGWHLGVQKSKTIEEQRSQLSMTEPWHQQTPRRHNKDDQPFSPLRLLTNCCSHLRARHMSTEAGPDIERTAAMFAAKIRRERQSNNLLFARFL